MKKYFVFALLLASVTARSQPLRDVNFAYLYDPDEQFSFKMKVVRGQESFTILYDLSVKDTAGLAEEYMITWEGRSMLSDKDGAPVVMKDHVVERNASGFQGRAMIGLNALPNFLLAKVIRNSMKRAWLFYAPLEPNLPVNNYLTRNGLVVTDPFIHHDETVEIAGDSSEWMVSFYDNDFPAAAPAYSEAQAAVSRGMNIDSVYAVKGGAPISFSAKGLYLVQKDTTSLEGFSFRSEDDYPQYSKLINLPGPLIYITTRQEYERLSASQGNKKAFDRVVLSITTDIERARTLLRNYFRRVELANRYFTSYKEGWKTDRGMIYIVFGRPTSVFKFNDREVWDYNDERFDIRFTFVRSSSLFDPDNFILIRDKKYQDTWYEVIDLWRNARF